MRGGREGEVEKRRGDGRTKMGTMGLGRGVGGRERRGGMAERGV